MTKKDLKNGMILEDRIGDKYLLCEGVMRGLSGYNLIYHYSDDLTVKDWSKRDIVKVYKDTGMYNLESIFKEDNLKLLWERKEPIELSKEEIQLLKALDVIGFKYIEKNIAEEPFAYITKPVKDKSSWLFNGNDIANDMAFFRLKKELFAFITWADEKPTSIQELLSDFEKGE